MQRQYQTILAAIATAVCFTQWPIVASTLPKNPGSPSYFQKIAAELGWQPDPSNFCQGYYKEPAIVKNYPHPGKINTELTHITAKGASTLSENGVSILQQDIVITQPGRRITSDKAYIYRNNKTGRVTKIILTGHVHLEESGRLIVSDKATITFYPQTIKLQHNAYHFYYQQFHSFGTAQYAIHLSTKKIILHHATYSTCSPLSPSWQVKASKLIINKETNKGKAYNAVVVFKHVPIFYTPYLNFSLKHQRKSGFLVPYFSDNRYSGQDYSWPFYWNMAPNYDMLIVPEYYSLRGSRLTTYFRYLTQRTIGTFYATFLPNDQAFQAFRNNAIAEYSSPIYKPRVMNPYLNQLRGEDNQRGFFSFNNNTTFDANWTSQTILNYATDPYFFQDLTLRAVGADTLTNQLLNYFNLAYSGDQWTFDTTLIDYQTLHIIGQFKNPALDQYSRLPEFSTTAYYPDTLLGADTEFSGDLSNFQYSSTLAPNYPTGQRLHIRPGLVWPIYFANGYVKPQLWVDTTAYTINDSNVFTKNNPSRTLPIVAVDNGYTFEKLTRLFGSIFTDIISPRLFYLYVPYTNQNNLPNFDSYLLPFDLTQITALNRYSSYDRLQNANQIGSSITQHLYNESGREIFSDSLGIIYYFTNPKVCLTPDCVMPQRQISPLFISATFNPTAHWSMNASTAWDAEFDRIDNTAGTLTYHKDADFSANLGFQFVREDNDSLNAADISNPNNLQYSTTTKLLTGGIAFPLSQKWRLFAYSDYNIAQRRLDTYYGGAEYNSCCWSLTFVAQRSYLNTTLSNSGSIINNFDTSYFVRFSLKGLGGAGTGDIENLLKTTIPGYGVN